MPYSEKFVVRTEEILISESTIADRRDLMVFFLTFLSDHPKIIPSTHQNYTFWYIIFRWFTPKIF